MKKALMVLGFALCTTMAFAQTTVAHRNNSKVTAQKPDLNALKAAAEQVDYKASIFTKDATFDTVFTFDFADMTGIDTAGYVQQNDVIVYNDHDSVMRTNYNTVRVQNEAWCKWRHYASDNDFKSRAASEYPITLQDFQASNWWVTNYTEGAFMLFCYDYDQVATAGIVHTYFTLPAKTRSAANKMVHVALSQLYFKYYDQCFVDYKINGKWYAREVNVTGVDCDVNSTLPSTPAMSCPSTWLPRPASNSVSVSSPPSVVPLTVTTGSSTASPSSATTVPSPGSSTIPAPLTASMA